MTGKVISPEAFQNSTAKAAVESEETLWIEQLKQGQQQALRQVYDKYHKRIYALCYRLSADQEIAEDITQEVFVQVWQKIHNFRADSKFSTWLHSVASNIAISFMRKQKPWWRSWFGTDEQNQAALDKMEVSDDMADYELTRSGLDKHIAQLPEQARIVFVLFAVEGWRHEEIAKQLKIAVGSSKSQFHRAKQLLQQTIKAEQQVAG